MGRRTGDFTMLTSAAAALCVGVSVMGVVAGAADLAVGVLVRRAGASAVASGELLE